MIEEFEYKGYWWLPEYSETRYCGTLKYIPGKRATLEIMGSFEDIENVASNSKLKIIHGFSSNGEEITLYKCRNRRTTLSAPGFQVTIYDTQMVFIGAYFKKEKDIKFIKLFIRYTYLDEWIHISGIEHSSYLGKKKLKLSIKYKQPESIQTFIDDNYKLSIHFKHIIPYESKREISIKERVSIEIESKKEKTIEEFLQIANHFGNFLSFGLMVPVYPLSISGYTKIKKERIEGKTYYPTVWIFYSLPNLQKPTANLSSDDTLYTFNEISERFEILIKNWFNKLSTLNPVFNLYFGVRYNPRMYFEHRFLSLIQAIESFHRCMFKGLYVSKKDYKKIYNKLFKTIPNDVESDHKDSLKSRLKYGNEYSLRKRLREIFNRYQDNLTIFIKNKEYFINKAVDTRNYLVHYSKELEKKAVKGENLYWLTQELKIILEICLLREVGFQSDEIEALLMKNRDFKNLKNHLLIT